VGFHIQLDLKAIEQAAAASGAEGIGVREHLAGLVLMFHHVWAQKSDHATAGLLMGWFAVAPDKVQRLAAGLVAFGHLEPQGDGWRIRGAKRYFSLREKFAEGGKKTQAARRAQAPASTSSSKSGPAAPSTPANGKPRSLSSQEQCWDIMERLRVEHCLRLGLAPGATTRPKYCNLKLNEACDSVALLDSIDGNEAFSRWDMLTLLFERYLADELGRNDKNGKPRDLPWPIALFLSPNVLQRFKREYEQEQAA
jgi:hypothetical protein